MNLACVLLLPRASALALPAPEPCPLASEDAADSNDDGGVDISDPIFSLGHLFFAGAPPPPPFRDAGDDSTEHGLGCDGRHA